jgi:hypothetical protein
MKAIRTEFSIRADVENRRKHRIAVRHINAHRLAIDRRNPPIRDQAPSPDPPPQLRMIRTRLLLPFRPQLPMQPQVLRHADRQLAYVPRLRRRRPPLQLAREAVDEEGLNMRNRRVVEHVVVAEVRADGRLDGTQDGGGDMVREGGDGADDIEKEGSWAFLAEEIGFRDDREVGGVSGKEVAVKRKVSELRRRDAMLNVLEKLLRIRMLDPLNRYRSSFHRIAVSR